MIGNYLKVLIRNLWKNKFFSLLNFLGLAIGMTCYLLIFQYATFELSYDDFHENKDRIYRLQIDRYKNNELREQSAQSPFSIGSAMKQEYPEIEEIVRCRMFLDNTVRCGEQIYRNEKIYITEPSFFKIFSFELLKGDPGTVLDGPNKVLLSESTAQKYFGTRDPLGQMIRISDKRRNFTCMVKGIFKDVPENSHMKFDMLVSMNTLFSSTYQEWVFQLFHTYILFKPGARPAALEAKLHDFILKYVVKHVPLAKTAWKFRIQPLKEIYLYSDLTYDTKNGDGEIVYFLLIVAFLILVISWINYVNLSTARAMERAREVGIRKVMGSFRVQLIKQFLTESVLVNIIPIIIAVILGIIFTPYLRALTGKNIPLYIAGDVGFWLHLLVLYIVGSLLSGLYPAFVLSSFKPVTVLKRSRLSHTTGGSLLRKFLVGFQFAASSILIIVTFSVYHQIQYMRNTDLGIDIKNMLGISLPIIPINQEFVNNATSLKTELLRYPAIKSVSGSTLIPGSDPKVRRMIWKEGDAFESGQIQSIIFVDYDFLPAYNIKLLAGRNFSKEYGTDIRAAILNEASIKLLGITKPADILDKNITIFNMPGKFKVIGIIKNYHHQSLRKNYDPIVFLYHPYLKSYYSLKLNPANTRDTLTTVADKWKEVFPGYPLDYFFLDDRFNDQYKADLDFGKVLGIFVILAIIITCMGLLSLSYFSALQRTREIGVRKSFGANVTDILILLTKDIVKLVAVATVAAWPIAFIILDNWLKNYAYRIGMPVLLFILSGLLVVIISLATVAYHTFRAARANPVEALREE